MKRLINIITNKFLWITIITLGFFYWANYYINMTSVVKQEVVAPKLKIARDLFGIDFPSPDWGWVVGEDGLIVHTKDQGQNWVVQQNDVIANLVSVHFFNTKKGFAVGASGTLLATEDSGNTWEKKSTETDAFLNDISFPTHENGFVVAERGLILFTEDSGVTWQQNNSLFEDALPWMVPELKSIYFASPESGWIVGEFGTVLSTVDGGKSWNKKDLGTDDTLYDVNFFDRDNGYIVGVQGILLATEDGGQTWHKDKTYKRNSDLYKIIYRDQKAKTPVYIAGRGEFIFKPNENARFRSVMVESFDIRYTWIYGVAFVDTTHAYAVGKSGLILHITRGEGDVWGELDYNLRLN